MVILRGFAGIFRESYGSLLGFCQVERNHWDFMGIRGVEDFMGSTGIQVIMSFEQYWKKSNDGAF